MSWTKEMKAEREIAAPVRSSLALIKQKVLAYQGDNTELQKLRLKALALDAEAASRKGSFPMEKLMGLVRKLKAKSSKSNVVLFFDAVQEDITVIEGGISKLVERNLGLVGHLVNQYLTHDDTYSREDRMQDGNTGLIKAAYRFDPERKIKFSTYACWWIKQEARLGYMAMARTIRWPSNVYQAMGKGEEAFIASMGRNGATVFAATCAPPLSLDVPAGPSGTEPLMNILKSTGSASVEDLVGDRETADIIKNSIDSALTEREAKVIRARFGIDQKTDYILADIGQLLGVSPERVRKIQETAIGKLRKCMDMNKLQEHYA